MYLFSRTVRLRAGDDREHMAWAASITEKVNQIVEIPVRLWTTVLSPGAGTLVWGTTVDNLDVLEASFDKLMADDGYHSLTAEGAKFASEDPVVDRLVQLVHVDTDVDVARVQYVNITSAVIAPGQFARGIELGVELAQRGKAITGTSTSFGIGVTGPYGAVGWISYHESIGGVQATEEALGADAGFTELIDKEASKAYMPGSANTMILRRLG